MRVYLQRGTNAFYIKYIYIYTEQTTKDLKEFSICAVITS
jgi:hypothetical protein